MSISVSVGFMIPANVVEVGNEITSDQLAALGAASAPSVANAYATNAFVTGQGYVTTSYTYEPKKAIANLCASCFTDNGSTFYFANYVAQCVAQGSKFTSGSAFLLGVGVPNSAPTYTFALTAGGATGVNTTPLAGNAICYSDDSGSSWTYSDLTF